MVPDSILEKLVCDICHKYLSVGPVKSFKHQKICGRCILFPPNGVKSMYNIVVEHANFKCINRFDGCKKTFGFAQMREHERVCISKKNKCPFYDIVDRMSNFQIVHHLKTKHDKYFLEKPNIRILLNQLEIHNMFWHINKDFIFFLYLTYYRKQLSLKTCYIGDNTFMISQNCILTLNDSNFNEKTIVCKPFQSTNTIMTELFRDENLDLESILNLKFQFKYHKQNVLMKEPTLLTQPLLPRKIKIENIAKLEKINLSISDCGTKLIKKLQNDEIIVINLECLFCKNITNVKFITKGGLTKNLICNFCWPINTVENVDISYYEMSDINDIMINYLSFSCKRGCPSFQKMDKILYHEDSCKSFQPPKCPIQNCYYFGYFEQMAPHLCKEHNTLLTRNCSQFSDKCESNCFNINLRKEIYIWVQNHYFQCQVSQDKKLFTIKVNIVNLNTDDDKNNNNFAVLVFGNSDFSLKNCLQIKGNVVFTTHSPFTLNLVFLDDDDNQV